MIIESYQTSADNTDLLKAPSRLAAIPENGTLTLEVSATAGTAANNAKVTVRTAEGDVPIREVLIPANGYDTTNSVLHGSTEWVVAMPVQQGQHVQIEVDVTGTVLVFVRATLA